MMGRVVLQKDIRIEKNFPEEWPARVAIDVLDGRHLETIIQHPKGDPKNPLSWDELIAKFKSLTGPVISASRSDEIIALTREGKCLHGLLEQL